MDVLIFHLQEVNWLGIAAATIATFLLGFLWYSQAGFGGTWMKEVGLKKKDTEKANMPVLISLSALLGILTIVGLAVLMCALALHSWIQGAALGMLVAVAFTLARSANHMLYELKSFKLFLLNGSYDLLFFAIAGGIIGAV